MTAIPEVWLRGPIEGIVPMLQPAAHTLEQVREDVLPLVENLTPAQLWARPGGGAAIGFHLGHLPGSLERLLSYSRGEALTEQQRAAMAIERSIYDHQPDLSSLVARFTQGIDAAIAYLKTLPTEALLLPREVGSKRLPSTTLGLIFHAAEHSARHAGQIVTLSKIVRA